VGTLLRRGAAQPIATSAADAKTNLLTLNPPSFPKGVLVNLSTGCQRDSQGSVVAEWPSRRHQLPKRLLPSLEKASVLCSASQQAAILVSDPPPLCLFVNFFIF
jgi:hypothetical protein